MSKPYLLGYLSLEDKEAGFVNKLVNETAAGVGGGAGIGAAGGAVFGEGDFKERTVEGALKGAMMGGGIMAGSAIGGKALPNHKGDLIGTGIGGGLGAYAGLKSDPEKEEPSAEKEAGTKADILKATGLGIAAGGAGTHLYNHATSPTETDINNEVRKMELSEAEKLVESLKRARDRKQGGYGGKTIHI